MVLTRCVRTAYAFVVMVTKVTDITAQVRVLIVSFTHIALKHCQRYKEYGSLCERRLETYVKDTRVIILHHP